jgi:hypothetical protein
VQGSAASPKLRQRASLPSLGHLVNVELRLSGRPSDCADIFGLVVPAQLGFLREVGTILRSAQSAGSRRRHNAESARIERVL